MASQGPNFVGTAADDASVGATTWSNTGNITAEDASSATTTTFGGNNRTHYLIGTNCGFSIPSGATIDGIVVEIKKTCNHAGGITDYRVRIVKGGSIGATDKSSAIQWSKNSLAYTTYGASNDLWGETWTDTDINASNFGVAISAQSAFFKVSITNSIDAMRITVYYTVASVTVSEVAHINNAIMSNFMIR